MPDAPSKWELAHEAFVTMPRRFTKHWVDGDPQEPDVVAETE